jgi:methylamine---glutamate N-methyltransferase subunit A
MCGIVGLFLKDRVFEPELGRLTQLMLDEMADRGPDSAGFAVYGNPHVGLTKICAVAIPGFDWQTSASALAAAIGAPVMLTTIEDHAVLTTAGDGDAARGWLMDHESRATVLSQGQSIEVFKGVGNPHEITMRLGLAGRTGSHAIGHTRMATESAVTIAGSHPFSTGYDTCLVHNGSLSNHNRLRQYLQRHGERFQTENDTEVAATYLAWKTKQGISLTQAMQDALKDLDGFFTFVVGTRDGFAVLRDPIACKPAVMAETPHWVAFGSEFRALAPLPDVDRARIWEPLPATVYAWSRAS